jgi:acetylornithine deacetylase
MSQEISHKDLMMEMLSIPAVSRQEEKRADFLAAFLEGMGADVTRIHHNLLVGHPGEDPGITQLLLNSHMDTISPAEGWQTDPFEPQLEKNRITGLGSNDAGASVVTLISTYFAMKEKLRETLNLMLLISCEEEVSGVHGITSVLADLKHIDAVIVGEPTGMRPAVAERGLMVIDAEVKGEAGHAARNEGVNAIYRAITDLEAIRVLQFPEPSHWLPAAGAQVTMISAGTGHNVVPDLCRYVVDVRSNDRYGNEEILEIIRSACAAEMKPRSTRLKPSSLDEDHFLMKTIRAAGMEPFGSSTLSDMALIPFPSVKMGPGDSARSHTAGEFILVEEMDQGIETYCSFLETMSHILKQQQNLSE